ncbi:MAG: DUF1501 domain-containing protein [Planctomycetes bacterium]|nr:DUF1501 domain-containing protein [Planctomycetota bacterium]
MLTIFDGNESIDRRAMLRIGSLGLAGLTLPTLLAARAAAGEKNAHLSGKSVIYLFQQGGPSQFETFDPKPDAPSGIRAATGTTQTKVPGLLFGDTMSRLATLADKLTVVRSFQTNNAGHNIQPIVGPDSLNTNIGVHYARVAGATRASSGTPTNAVIYPSAVSEEVPGPQARGNLKATGSYGSAYTPFVPGAGGELQNDMKLNLPRERFFDDRRSLLAQIDRLNRKMDAGGQIETMDKLQQQAYGLLLGGGVAEALDLSKEDAKTVARYDTSHFAKKGQWNKAKRGQAGYYDAQAATIGKLLLLARRLCEAGCGFVTIHASYAGVWDMHADGNNLNMVDGMQAVGRSFDHAVAAFIEDLEERGLTDKIMLVASGEMGRTPKINKNGGRNHWAKLAPLLLHGGGVRGGQVIGQSTRDGGEPATENLTPKHLISTIMHTLFDVGQLRLARGVPPQVARLTQAQPIVEVS